MIDAANESQARITASFGNAVLIACVGDDFLAVVIAVSLVMPIGENGFRSMQRTSTYSTPRSFSACRGRSPELMRRFGRIVP